MSLPAYLPPIILTPAEALSRPADDVMCFGFVTYQEADAWQQSPRTPDEIADILLDEHLAGYRAAGMQIIEVEGIQVFSCEEVGQIITLWRIEMRHAPTPADCPPPPWIDPTVKH